MALFGTLNVAGPANRGATIQSLAQNAAQAVLRRQRLKALLQQSAAAAGSHGGPGLPMHSSMRGHAVGARGMTQRPDLTADQLSEMARSAGRSGHVPGSVGGVFGRGGGGYDFGALPAPSDHAQSPASIGASPFHSNPTAPAAEPRPPVGAFVSNPNIPGGGYINDNAGPNPATAVSTMQSANDAQAGSGGAIHGWISLGGGLFYDPVNDIVRGPSAGISNGLVGQDGKF